MKRRGKTGSGMSPLGPMLKRMLEDMGLDSKVRERQALAEWAAVVGPQIAAVTTAADIREGVLFVSCRSSAWSNELSFHKPEIIARLNKAVGGEAVKDIRFSARGFKRGSGAGSDAPAYDDSGSAEVVEITEEDREKARAVAESSGSQDLAERICRAVMAGRRLSEQKRREGWKTCPGCGSPYPGQGEACEHCLPR